MNYPFKNMKFNQKIVKMNLKLKKEKLNKILMKMKKNFF